MEKRVFSQPFRFYTLSFIGENGGDFTSGQILGARRLSYSASRIEACTDLRLRGQGLALRILAGSLSRPSRAAF